MLKRGIRSFCWSSVAAAVLTLSACGPFVSSRPDFTGPISITLKDDEIVWVNCSSSSIIIHAASLLVVQTSGPDLGYVRESEDQTIRIGTEVAVTEAEVGDLAVYYREPYSFSSLSEEFSVSVVVVGDGVRAENTFDNVTAANLKEGAYIYADGRAGIDPCPRG